MKRVLLVVCCLAAVLTAGAQTARDIGMRHQVRVGWGDAIFESIAFSNTSPHKYANPGSLPETFSVQERYNSACTGHFFAEYQYRTSRVVRIGVQLDVEGIFWQEGYFDRYHNLIGTGKKVRNYNIVAMPTARFSYLNTRVVSLYSGAGAGLLVALDNAGGSALSPAFNLNLVGVQLGSGHWSGSMELGFMAALSGTNKVYMLGSRLVSISLNYAW